MKPDAPDACCIWEYVDWRPLATIEYVVPSMRRHSSKAANRRTYTILAESFTGLDLWRRSFGEWEHATHYAVEVRRKKVLNTPHASGSVSDSIMHIAMNLCCTD